VVVQRAPLAEVQGKATSQTPPPTKAMGKSHVAPAPRVGGSAVSPGGSTVLSSCGAVDAPQGERARKGSLT
jgi:hypothetical protein